MGVLSLAEGTYPSLGVVPTLAREVPPGQGRYLPSQGRYLLVKRCQVVKKMSNVKGRYLPSQGRYPPQKDVKKMSSCQKDVKCQKVKHMDYGRGSQKK